MARCGAQLMWTLVPHEQPPKEPDFSLKSPVLPNIGRCRLGKVVKDFTTDVYMEFISLTSIFTSP